MNSYFKKIPIALKDYYNKRRTNRSVNRSKSIKRYHPDLYTTKSFDRPKYAFPFEIIYILVLMTLITLYWIL